MLGSPNQRIMKPIGLWLNINSLSTVPSKDTGGPQKKIIWIRCPYSSKKMSPSIKIKTFQINSIEPLLL